MTGVTHKMVVEAAEMLENRIENGYPIATHETPETIANEIIEQSNPWPDAPHKSCVAAVRVALDAMRNDK